MSGHRSRYNNCGPEPATAVQAWYQWPDGRCEEVEVVRLDNTCDPMIFRLGTREQISPFSAQRLHYTNPCAENADCCPDMEMECWVLVENQWAYDNGGGDPAELPPGVSCGDIEGPIGPVLGAPFMPCVEELEIISWIIEGDEVVTTPVPFNATEQTPENGWCGNGTGTGMHDAWAVALESVDSEGQAWSAEHQPGCNWLVRTVDSSYGIIYGAMQVRSREDPTRVWTITPAQSEFLTFFTRIVTRQPDGSIEITWLDNDGNPVPKPEGDLRSCEAYSAQKAAMTSSPIRRDIEPIGCQLDGSGQVIGRVFLAEISNEDGAAIGTELMAVALNGAVTRPYEGDWSPCPAVESPVQYTAEVATPEGIVFTLGTANQDLYSVSIRHRSGTVVVNGVEMDPGEVISWDAGDDPNGFLFPDIGVDATNGSARVVYQRGGYPQ